MDYYLAVSTIYPGATFNPACFDFSEAVARQKKLWTDDRAMPTQAELEAAEARANELITLAKAEDKIKKDLLKDKSAPIKDRVQALVEHFGLDI